MTVAEGLSSWSRSAWFSKVSSNGRSHQAGTPSVSTSPGQSLSRPGAAYGAIIARTSGYVVVGCGRTITSGYVGPMSPCRRQAVTGPEAASCGCARQFLSRFETLDQ